MRFWMDWKVLRLECKDVKYTQLNKKHLLSQDFIWCDGIGCLVIAESVIILCRLVEAWVGVHVGDIFGSCEASRSIECAYP